MEKRNLFEELAEGFEALADGRAGKLTLSTHEIEENPAPNLNAKEAAAKLW